ncbi:MAG: hydrolase [Microbacteriaceae bacterium]|nr:MAG: hydrolase [Microbacteriaceae bacterium]
MSGHSTHQLRSATLKDGRVVDVMIRDGRITDVVESESPGGRESRFGESMAGFEPPADIDLSGYVLLPSPVEPHAHLDKALVAARVPNVTGDLAGAIEAIEAAYDSMTPEDIGRRALAALTAAVTHGYTAVRTHVDCGVGVGMRGVDALVEVRERLQGIVDVQVVALSKDVSGPSGVVGRELLDQAMSAGADIVGGCPALEDDRVGSLVELMAVARAYGKGMDLHLDETTDPQMLVLRSLADMVCTTGFALPVTASHCVSLGVQDRETASATARAVADAGVGVITLPQTNLYLQGRESVTKKPRGLTAVRTLIDAGVTVAGGSDNWRDPFNPMGRIDAMETASLLVSAAHLRTLEAYASVSSCARAVMGLPSVEVAVGFPADLLAIKGESLEQAMAQSSEDRIVIKSGRILARTVVSTELHPELLGR